MVLLPCVLVALLAGPALATGGISLSISETRVIRGVNSSLIVSCDGSQGVTWLNPSGDQIKSTKGRVHLEGSPKKGVSLVLENIVKQDKGNYTCRAVVDGKMATASFQLLVVDPLAFVDTPTVQTATLHSNVVLRCEVIGDFDTSIGWQRNGLPPKGPRYKVVNDGLTILNATLEDEGVYVCRAYQVSQLTTDSLERNITLRVEHAPMWLEGENPDVSYGLVNGSVNLTCAVRAYPPATFRWLRGDSPITPATHRNVTLYEDDNVATLQLWVGDDSVFGNYSCKALNKLGEAERSMVLRRGTKPQPPASVTIEASEDDAMSLDIDEAAGAEGEVVGYRVQYRPKGTNSTWDTAHFIDMKKGVKPYRVSGLAHNVDYEVRVATRNAAGYSDFSPEILYKNPQAQAEQVSSAGPAVTAGTGPLPPLLGAALFLWL